MGCDFGGARVCDPQRVRTFRGARSNPEPFCWRSCCGSQTRAPSALRRLADSPQIRFNIGVSQPPKARRPGPPHNPGVRDLVEGKRHGSLPLKPEDARHGFHGWNERGYLPHRDDPGLIQFVTFRLADSFPERLRSEWEFLLKIGDEQQRRAELEAYLDEGRGECHRCRPEIATLVENNFRHFSGDRYELRTWVVMPNHVHVLFKVGTVPMSETVGAWKKHTGRLANGRRRLTPSSRSRPSGRWPCRPSCRRSRDHPAVRAARASSRAPVFSRK